ncbi:GNAT family N-acetyltransferase [uncultured Stenotrophomonas sp.]|uniref:GNAT family N-acetyltransferase n=1 Tax=uncultured Stenotrophomonas sp. TaxID=165438 RepID=UPI0025D862D2|nr:GNAT family N-acetyltransferase [uncultured Stenotrophomonas sp.]
MPKIRPARIDDLPAISAVCLAAFHAAVAPSLSANGIATFTRVAAIDAFGARLQGDNLILVAEQDARIVGVVELKEGRHLAMLFVDPACQGQGIGHALFEAVLPKARVPMLTVRASLNAVPTYLRYGFVLDGEVGEFNGLVYQQMVCTTPASVAAAAAAH